MSKTKKNTEIGKGYFRVFNYFHIQCVDCNKITIVNPGDYLVIESDCDCKKRKRKRNDKTSKNSK